METDLTQGSIKKHYLKYLSAGFGGAMISSIYSMVDAAVVGQYQGPQGSATLSIVMPIWTILYSLGLLIGIGGSVNYAFFKSQGKTNKANAYFTLSLVLTTIVSILCWIGMTVFDEQLLRLFGADDSLMVLAQEYLKPIKYIIPVYPFSQFLAAFLRNDHAPGRATAAILAGGIFNIFGDVFFVFGLNLGIYGAGLATAIGGCISIVVLLSHFVSKTNTLKISKIYGHVHKMRLLTINGFSSFISDIAMGVIAMLFNRQIMHYLNSDALAVFGIIVQVTTIVQCSTYGVGQAIQPIVSVNYGAGKKERIKEAKTYGLWTVVLLSIVWTGLVMLIPNGIIRLFMSPTNHVLQIAPTIMRVYALSYLFLPLNIFAIYYFPSVMKPNIALIISFARGMVLCGILVYVLPMLFGSFAIWWVMPITETLVAIYVGYCMSKYA